MPTRITSYATAEFITGEQADTSLVITSPVDGALVNSANVPVVWTFGATQDQYRAQIYSDADGETIVFDSQWVTSAVQSATLATGSALTSNRLYYIRVFAHGTLGEVGESEIESFYFALPASVNVTGLGAQPFPACAPSPQDNPGILLHWSAVAHTGTFLWYEVRRRKAGETTYLKIKRFAESITSWLDASVQPGIMYEYTVVFYEDDATPQTLVSTEQSPPSRAMVTFDWTYVHEVESPNEFFRFDAEDGSVESQLDMTIAQTWGRREATAFIGEAVATTIEMQGLEQLRRRPALWSKWTRMLERQATERTTLCLRLGIDHERYFVALPSVSKSLSQKSWAGPLRFTEIHYDEDLGLYLHVAGESA